MLAEEGADGGFFGTRSVRVLNFLITLKTVDLFR